MRRVGFRLAALLGPAVLLAGCGVDRYDGLGPDVPNGQAPAGGIAVNGLQREWAIQVDLAHVSAGPVRFTFRNVGTTIHEMLVVKTDLPLLTIPVDPSTKRFSEESTQWEVIDEISEYEVGTTKDLTLDLSPGRYQLVCNLPSHYSNGMAAAFTVN